MLNNVFPCYRVIINDVNDFFCEEIAADDDVDVVDVDVPYFTVNEETRDDFERPSVIQWAPRTS